MASTFNNSRVRALRCALEAKELSQQELVKWGIYFVRSPAAAFDKYANDQELAKRALDVLEDWLKEAVSRRAIDDVISPLMTHSQSVHTDRKWMRSAAHAVVEVGHAAIFRRKALEHVVIATDGSVRAMAQLRQMLRGDVQEQIGFHNDDYVQGMNGFLDTLRDYRLPPQ